MTLREGRQALAGVGDRFLGEDLAGGREDTGAVLAVPEVNSDGNVVRGHKAESLTQRTSKCDAPLDAFSFLLVRHYFSSGAACAISLIDAQPVGLEADLT